MIAFQINIQTLKQSIKNFIGIDESYSSAVLTTNHKGITDITLFWMDLSDKFAIAINISWPFLLNDLRIIFGRLSSCLQLFCKPILVEDNSLTFTENRCSTIAQ